MKSKLLSTFSLLRLSVIAALAMFCVSCDKTETTDSTGFILHYYGVTDIGPSMSYSLQAPSYKGSAPYDFTITKVTLNDEAFTNADNFVIDPETGAIAIQNTEAMSAGLYSISVGCYSNGKFFDFEDAIQVNMLLAVPEGITVEPAEVTVNLDEENWAKTATSQVSTEADKHVTITGYAFAQDESKPYSQYFAINGDGKISIKSGVTEEQLPAGEYTLDLKLTTKAGEHLYANAVTFKVIARPRNLFYAEQSALPDLFETGQEGKSPVPTVGGSQEGVKFAIKSVTPESSAFVIDETTGQISLPAGHTLPVSTEPYVFTITVSNIHGSQDFEAAYAASIVAFIEPIDADKFHYTAIDKLYQLGGKVDEQKPDEGFVGGAVTFAFDEANSEEVKAQIAAGVITLNSGNGAISIADTHTLSAATHDIMVKVTNKKNEEGVVKALSVTVLENPNDFTYVSWGTNIENVITINEKQNKTIPISTETVEETKAENRNQFRYIQGRDVRDIPLQKIQMAKEGTTATFTYKIIKDNYIGHPNIIKGAEIKEDGTIYFTNLTAKKNFADGSNNAKGCVFQIKVTASGNNAPTVSRNIPIFISTPKPGSIAYPIITETTNKLNYTLLCTPFVVKVNPKTGKCASFTAEMHSIGASDVNGVQTNYSMWKGVLDAYQSTFIWDYRDDFTYCNLDDNEKHITGDRSDNTLLNQIWSNMGVATTTNSPFRYYDQVNGVPDKQSIKALYINADDHQIVINPDVWKAADGKYPYGAILGSTRFTIENAPKNLETNTRVTTQYPLILWLDENFE